MIDGMTIYDAQQLTDALKQVSFGQVAVCRNKKKHWLCLTARKD